MTYISPIRTTLFVPSRRAQCAELTHLNLTACMLESAGMRAVCRALRRSRAPLLHVDLSMNDAASFAAPAIARLLVAKRRTLECVALDDNSLRASGAKVVCAALARLPALRTATLSNTQLKVCDSKI